MKMTIRWMMAAALTAGFGMSAQATDRYVSLTGAQQSPFTNWTSAARDIQTAVDVSSNSDQVIVAAGTYYLTSTLTISKSITVRSLNGARTTIIDGNYPSRNITAVQITTQPAVLDGFTITKFGNGVFVNHGEGTEGQPRNCLIVYNNGYGIYFNHGGGAKNCTVAYNGGAGLYAYDMGGGGDDPDNMIIWANAGGDFVKNSANIGLNTSWTNDPHFVSKDDFSLLSDSPCIDAGHNEAWMSTSEDADGGPRIINGTADIGAYEYPGSQTHYVSLTGHNQPPFTNWWGAATNIQAAVDAASDGEMVFVNSGTYVLTNQISVTKGVNIVGVQGADSTIIDGNYPATTNRCFYLANANARVSGFSIVNGCAGAYGWGSGVEAVPGNVDHCVIANNIGLVNARGCGVYISGGTLDSCIITNHAAALYGCGVNASGGAVISNCQISDNGFATVSSSLTGGGIRISGGTMRNCLIARNIAGGGGAGIWVAGSTVIENCTVVSNVTLSAGGGIYVGATTTARNLIVYGNSDSGNGNYYNLTDCTYSCVTPALSGTGNITGAPLFMNAAANDYRLSWTSPCIDKGTNQSWMATATDLTGNPRIVNNAVDMGAYEAIPDTDGDGIPDWWMIQYFGHPTGQAGDHSLAGDDPDGDGYTNLEEFQNGGNPLKFDVGSAYIWTAVEIGWKGVAGTNYQVQYATDLAKGNWTNWGGTIVGNGSTTTILDSTRTNIHKFYRVVVP